MKRGKWWFTGLFIALFLAFSIMGGAKEQKKELSIIFTHDLHSNFDSFKFEENGDVKEVGGFARIKTVIDEKMAEDEHTLVIDAGDFSMGTLYQTIFEEEAAELRLLGAMGFDVTTLGNHELDYRDEKFGNMLMNALKSGDVLPQMALTNIDWDGVSPELLEVKAAMDAYGVKPYIMIEKGDFNIAVMGIFGKESLSYSPMTKLQFKDPVESAKETVALIKDNEEADIIICLSHSGTSKVKKESEDEILAEKVPEIDIIISGHTHTTLTEPIISGNTIIGSTGSYGMQIGSMNVRMAENGRWELVNYELISIDESIAENKEIASEIEVFKSYIQDAYLEQYGYEYNQVLAKNPYSFTSIKQLGEVHEEEPLGNLLSDAYIYTMKELVKNQEDLMVTVVPNGVIRDSFYAGEITVSDVFNVSSLGVGKDKIPGYPLIKVYLTGAELKTAAEVDASISPIMGEARLNIGGLRFTFNPKRMILNKVTDVYLMNEVKSYIELDDDRLYPVVADLYSGQMLGAVSAKSYGILSIVPKDKDGNPVTDLEDQIVYYDGQELKAWVAIAKYIESFPKEDGVSVIPEYYSETQERKVVDANSNLWQRIKNPNKIAIIIYIIILAVVMIVVLVIVLVVKKIKKARIKKRMK